MTSRNTLLHAFHFAFGKQPDLNRLVSMIARGQSTSDKLQSLKDMAVTGRRHRGQAQARPKTKRPSALSYDPGL